MKRVHKLLILITVLAMILSSMTAFANATELKTGIGIVTANSGLRLRASASTDSQVINTAMPGDNAVIIGQRGEGTRECGTGLRLRQPLCVQYALRPQHR